MSDELTVVEEALEAHPELARALRPSRLRLLALLRELEARETDTRQDSGDVEAQDDGRGPR